MVVVLGSMTALALAAWSFAQPSGPPAPSPGPERQAGRDDRAQGGDRVQRDDRGPRDDRVQRDDRGPREEGRRDTRWDERRMPGAGGPSAPGWPDERERVGRKEGRGPMPPFGSGMGPMDPMEHMHRFLDFAQTWTDTCDNPERVGVMAVGQITELFEPREGVGEATELLEKLLKEVRAPIIRNAIRFSLKENYVRMGKTDQAVEQLVQLVKENAALLEKGDKPEPKETREKR